MPKRKKGNRRKKRKGNMPRLCNCPIYLSLSTYQKMGSPVEEAGKDGGYISLGQIYPLNRRHYSPSLPELISRRFCCPLDPPYQSIFPLTRCPKYFCPCFTLAIVGGDLYCLGGGSVVSPPDVSRASIIYEGINNSFASSTHFFVHKIDASGWEPLPSMSIPRYRPSVLTHCGKIYAFGCGLTPLGKLTCFAEVYDTNSLTPHWEPLIMTLPHCVSHHTMARVACSFLDSNTKVLVVFPFEYRAITLSLPSRSSPSQTLVTCSVSPPPTCSVSPNVLPGSSNFVVVDDFVFFFPLQSFHLHAIRLQNGNFALNPYDSEKSVFEVEGSDIITKDLGPVPHPSFLFHTGQMRFLLVSANYVRLFCFWFRVVNNCKNLRVVLDGQSSYPQGDSLLVDATMQCNCQVNLIEKERGESTSIGNRDTDSA